MRLERTLTEDGALVLTMPQPKRPLSINRSNTMHWATRDAMLKPWKTLATIAMRQARGDWGDHRPVTLRLELEFRTRIRRDPHNYVGTVVKAVVDGLTTGGLIPDDTPEWATVLEPTLVIQPDKSRPLAARVIITPRSATT